MPGTKTERETDQNPYKIYKRKYTKNIYMYKYMIITVMMTATFGRTSKNR